MGSISKTANPQGAYSQPTIIEAVDNPRNGSHIATEVDSLRQAKFAAVESYMSTFDIVESFRKNAIPFRRQVTISRDGEDFVVTFLPQNIVAMRHSEAKELRRMCHSLRWEIVRDTMPEPNDIRSW